MPGTRWIGSTGLVRLVLTSSLALLCRPSQAEVVRQVRTTGTAAVLGGDTAQAFQRARRQALRQAVEEGAGVLVGSRSTVVDQALVGDVIRTETSGWVRRFTVVSQGEGADHVYRVTVDAVVVLDSLAGVLEGMGLSAVQLGRPHLQVCGEEFVKRNGTFEQVHWGLVTTVLERAILEHQDVQWVLVAGPRSPATETEASCCVDSSGLGTDDWVDLRMDVRAMVEQTHDIPVPGSASTLEDLGIISATATIHVEARWADTQELVAAAEGSSSGAGTTLEKAAQNAMDAGVRRLGRVVVEQMASDWCARAYSSRLIRLKLLADAATCTEFQREFAARVAAVQELEPRRLGQGEAVFAVRATGSAFELARQLASAGMQGMEVEVISATPNSLTLRVQQ